MDSKLRCVFEMPNENDKLVSKEEETVRFVPLTGRISQKCQIFFNLFDLMIK